MPMDSHAEITAMLLRNCWPLLTAGVLSFCATPFVKKLAHKIGAIDVPKDNRRMHSVPIPRLGGLAIFFGFLVSILIFGYQDQAMRGMLLGAVMIVTLGVVDDVTPLPAWIKLIIQIAAALVAVLHGARIEMLTNPNLLSDKLYLVLGGWSIPVTVLWIVGITNAVNLIDGLDGLAVGVSSIASFSMLTIALIVKEPALAVVMAALLGACLGFMPYNMNPAKIFMGDTGATFLGYILAVVSVEGLFKFYTIISFAVPFLILGLPIFDTGFAILRRVACGKSPMSADRGHVHHRLIDMGFNQKQSVAILYAISALLGLSAVVLTSKGELKALILVVSIVAAAIIASRVMPGAKNHRLPDTDSLPEAEEPALTAEKKTPEKGRDEENDPSAGAENGQKE